MALFLTEVACPYCHEPIDPVDGVAVTCSVCGEDACKEHVVLVPGPVRAHSWLDPDDNETPVCLACIEAAENRELRREVLADAC